MEEKNWAVLVTEDLRPEYYDRFRCLAADCRISCCKGWNITFNKKDYLSLKRQTGSPALEETLALGVRRIRRREHIHYGEFDMSSGVCPLLGEDSLCRLQAEKGHAALPDVCQTFPRIQTHIISGYLERSLSLACEGVLALLWDFPEGIGFLSDPLPKGQGKELTVTCSGTALPPSSPPSGSGASTCSRTGASLCPSGSSSWAQPCGSWRRGRRTSPPGSVAPGPWRIRRGPGNCWTRRRGRRPCPCS